jgi:hypothetical protein
MFATQRPTMLLYQSRQGAKYQPRKTPLFLSVFDDGYPGGDAGSSAVGWPDLHLSKKYLRRAARLIVVTAQ